MKLKNKSVFVYDIEIFPNLFTCTLKNTDSNNVKTFQVSEVKNDLYNLIKIFLNKNILFCGYNNLHYDDAIINYTLLNYYDLIKRPNWEITNSLYNLSTTIITSEDGKYSAWSKYKYAHCFSSFDLLTMMFSSKLRVGLKELQVTMQYPNVQEYDGNFKDNVSIKDIANVIKYNVNDVESTTELLYKLQKDIELRLDIEKEYGIDVLSKDGMTIGMEIIKMKYLEKTGKTWSAIKDLRDPCNEIKLNEVIFPFIKFESSILQNILSEAKQQIVSPERKGYERHFLFGGLEIVLGVGGIHSIGNPGIFKSDKNWQLKDSDVNSLYPSLIISYELYPPQLGKDFLDIYSQIRTERLEAKRNKQTVKNQTLKLALNGLSGNLQNEYNFCYSPKTVMKIRMNGQFLLLMLAEKLVNIGCKLIQINTDGIMYQAPISKKEELQNKLQQWEQETKLTLETDNFDAFYQFAINDYIAVEKGYYTSKDPKLIKTKGLFINKVALGKGMQPMIIPKVLIEYFVNNQDPIKILMSSNDIRDFCTYQKVDKKFTVSYGGKEITHINRYYMSTNGKELIKYIKEEDLKIRPTLLCAGSPVTLINKFNDLSIKNKDINYNYYRKEIYKIIDTMENNQLSLFNE